MLVNHHIDGLLVDEGIVDAEPAREARSFDSIGTELAAGLGYTGVVDGGGGSLEETGAECGNCELHDGETERAGLLTSCR